MHAADERRRHKITSWYRVIRWSHPRVWLSAPLLQRQVKLKSKKSTNPYSSESSSWSAHKLRRRFSKLEVPIPPEYQNFYQGDVQDAPEVISRPSPITTNVSAFNEARFNLKQPNEMTKVEDGQGMKTFCRRRPAVSATGKPAQEMNTILRTFQYRHESHSRVSGFR